MLNPSFSQLIMYPPHVCMGGGGGVVYCFFLSVCLSVHHKSWYAYLLLYVDWYNSIANLTTAIILTRILLKIALSTIILPYLLDHFCKSYTLHLLTIFYQNVCMLNSYILNGNSSKLDMLTIIQRVLTVLLPFLT